MDTRENEGQINEKSKQHKPNDEPDQNEIQVAVDVQNEMQPSAIFKLNAICCDDLFEWLSLKDLHSLGQTCKRMRQLTVAYFQENFKYPFICIYQSIYYPNTDIQLNGFVKFVQKIVVHQDENLQYIGSNCDSLREISLNEVEFTKPMIDFIKEKLNKIENIRLTELDFKSINLYEDFLIFCSSLKSLLFDLCVSDENDWMCNKYPKLTHLTIMRQIKNFGQNIGIFFQQNPQLKSFGCDSCFLFRNSETFLNSMMKLDVLYIDCRSKEFNGISALLNKLYDNGFYKRLEIKCEEYKQHHINLISKLPGLEKLFGNFEKENIVFPLFDSLQELLILDSPRGSHFRKNNYSAMIDAFPNLRFVFSEETKEINRLLPFIRQLPKLKELYIPGFHEDSNGFEIDLSQLNKERIKLPGACKLTIYVSENTYLKTKMAPKNLYTNHDLIEIKRSDHHDFLPRGF